MDRLSAHPPITVILYEVFCLNPDTTPLHHLRLTRALTPGHVEDAGKRHMRGRRVELVFCANEGHVFPLHGNEELLRQVFRALRWRLGVLLDVAS